MPTLLAQIDDGSDLACVADLDPAMSEVSSAKNVAQSLARRLTTPRGRLIDDPNYGFDLTQYLNDDVSPADLARIKAQAEAECLKDERVASATFTMTMPANGVAIVTIVTTGSAGPFTLVLSVTSVTATILSVQ